MRILVILLLLFLAGSGSLKATGVNGSTVVTNYGDSNTAGVSVVVINNVGGPTKYFVQQNSYYMFISKIGRAHV